MMYQNLLIQLKVKIELFIILTHEFWEFPVRFTVTQSQENVNTAVWQTT